MTPIFKSFTILGLGLGLVSALLLAGPMTAAPGSVEYPGLQNDPWGLYLKGELVAPERDEADEIRLEFGWPRRMVTEAPLWGRSPAIVDIDGNGDWEIAIVNGEGRLFVYQHNGALFPGFPTQQYRGNRPDYWEDPTHRAVASVGDVDRDASADLIYATDLGHLHVVGRNQDEPNPFPKDLGRGIRTSPVVTIDLNNDQSSEMVFTTYSIRPLNGDEALLHILDGSGNELNGWPVRCGVGSGSAPAVGDIDGDNAEEIVVASGRSGNTPGQVWAFELDGSRVNGFPQGSYESIDGSAILAGWDAGAGLDIIFAATPLNGNSCALYALNFRGAVIAGFPKVIGNGHPFGNPIVGGEVFEGRYSAIYFGGFDPGGNAQIRGLGDVAGVDSLDEIFSLDVDIGVVGSVVTADILGDDSQSEIVAALAPSRVHEGRIVIANNEETAWIDLDDYGGGAFASSPTLWDVDRDGHTEIIAVTTDGRLLVWHTEGIFQGEIWPTERGDFTRSGRKMPYFDLDVGGSAGSGSTPVHFLLSSYPNPFNSRLTVSFASPTAGEFSVGIYDLRGRALADQSAELKVGGIANFTFDAGNLGLPSGVYIMRWSAGDRVNGSHSVIYLP